MSTAREIAQSQVRLEDAYFAALQAEDSRGLRIMLLPRPTDAQALRRQIVEMSKDLSGEHIRMTPDGVEQDPLGLVTLANHLALVTEVYAALLAWKRLNERRETTMSADG